MYVGNYFSVVFNFVVGIFLFFKCTFEVVVFLYLIWFCVGLIHMRMQKCKMINGGSFRFDYCLFVFCIICYGYSCWCCFRTICDKKHSIFGKKYADKLNVAR